MQHKSKITRKKLLVFLLVVGVIIGLAVLAYNRATYEQKPTGGCNYYADKVEISAAEAEKSPGTTSTVCN